jgi:hypothetical protein
MSITWNTGSAAERFRHNPKLKLKNKNKKKKQASNKRALTNKRLEKATMI